MPSFALAPTKIPIDLPDPNSLEIPPAALRFLLKDSGIGRLVLRYSSVSSLPLSEGESQHRAVPQDFRSNQRVISGDNHSMLTLEPSCCLWKVTLRRVPHSPPLALTRMASQQLGLALSHAVSSRRRRCEPVIVFKPLELGTTSHEDRSRAS